MKFTPEQVIEMANECGLVGYGEDAGEYRIPAVAFHLRMERLCTLAADRALEAAESALIAEQVEDTGEEGDVAYNLAIGHGIAAIRAMKEHQ